MPSFAAFEEELPTIMAKFLTWSDLYWARAFRMKLNLEHGLGRCYYRVENDINWVTWRMQELLLQVPLDPAVLIVKEKAVAWAMWLALQDIQQNARKLPIQGARQSKHDEVWLRFQHAREKALQRSVQDPEARGSSMLALQDAERAELGSLIHH